MDFCQSVKEFKVRHITTTMIGEISQKIPGIVPETLGLEVNSIFETHNEFQGVPVIQDHKPVGLLMKHKFNHHLGKQYGYSIIMQRSIEHLMDQNPLIVDYKTPLDQVSDIAMSRKDDALYDYIIVTNHGAYHGIATVKDLLQKTTEIQLERAIYASPLTGLPGNNMIEQKLRQMVAARHDYAVMYFDLDHFKPYNDVYGFSKGDKLIEMTARCIEQRMSALNVKDRFLGHIGGDDFVAIVTSHDIKRLCEAIIDKFNAEVMSFYSEQDRNNGYVVAENRRGEWDKFPLVQLSIAVVTNCGQQFDNISQLSEYASLIKRKCKLLPKSSYLIDGSCEDC